MDRSSESRVISHGGSEIVFWTDTIKYLNNKSVS
jgi:hypothetical protein